MYKNQQTQTQLWLTIYKYRRFWEHLRLMMRKRHATILLTLRVVVQMDIMTKRMMNQMADVVGITTRLNLG